MRQSEQLEAPEERNTELVVCEWGQFLMDKLQHEACRKKPIIKPQPRGSSSIKQSQLQVSMIGVLPDRVCHQLKTSGSGCGLGFVMASFTGTSGQTSTWYSGSINGARYPELCACMRETNNIHEHYRKRAACAQPTQAAHIL